MSDSSESQSTNSMPSSMVALFAVASGLAVANIYYTQPLISLISPDIGISAGLAGLIVAFVQLGYGLGLLFLVPIADVIENRRLTVYLMAGVVVGLVGIALSSSVFTFLLSCLLVGVCAVAAQVLVPMASHLAPEQSRGRVVGNVMGGLIAGIMLARPFSSLVADYWGWRAVFWVTAAIMLATLLVLSRALPQRPSRHGRYGEIIASLPKIFAGTPLLRRKALYQGMMFAAFNLFWTGVPLLLGSKFGFSQSGIALFALAGAGGALAAPMAGRLADRGLTMAGTGAGLVVGALALVLAGWAGSGLHLVLLVIAAIILDAAVQTCQVLNLRSIYMLAPHLRGRLNGLFMTAVFICGACGSAFAAALYAYWGWLGVVALATLCPLVAFVAFLFEARHQQSK